jgi:hypothetical protein
MNFSFDKFLRPLTSSDRNIKIHTDDGLVKYTVNPFSVKNIHLSNNLVYIHLESDRNIILTFPTVSEAKLAIQKLQLYIDTLKDKVPFYLERAVLDQINKFTVGPTGSKGDQGIQGEYGLKGDDGDPGRSAYDIWLDTHIGGPDVFLESLVGPPGPTGPLAIGDSGELLIDGQSISATIDNKDIEIITKGSGNLLFKIDRNGWVVNYGIAGNTVEEIWSTSTTSDDEGNLYTTGGDFTTGTAYLLKTGKSGQTIWQKTLDGYSYGESIVYSNGSLFLLLTDINNNFGILILKVSTDGLILDQWS